MLHHFLSQPFLINPQLNYLLCLQNFRETTNGILDSFFLFVTAFGEFIIPLAFMCIIYWCVDKKKGIYLFSLYVFGLLISQIIKIVAGVYRPWILSSEIKPVEKAILTAHGYSFPSGHTIGAATSFGGAAFLWRKKTVLRNLFIVLVFLVAFSRNYLGVHTIQDVLAAILIGVILIFLNVKILRWVQYSKGRSILLFVIANLLCFLALIVCYFKNYPTDFLNGMLLVDPKDAKISFCVNISYVLGVLNGIFLCANFVPFETNIALKGKFYRFIIGFLSTFLIAYIFQQFLLAFFGALVAKFVPPFILGFFVTFVYPLLFYRFSKS